MKKRWKISSYLIGCSLLLTGCQHMTDEQLVVKKEIMEDAKTIDEGSAGDVAEQVQVSEERTKQDYLTDGIVNIRVNAEIEIPQVDGIRLKRVQTRVFQTKDLEKMQKAVMQGKPIRQRILTDENQCLTKKELEELKEKYSLKAEQVYSEEWDQKFLGDQIQLWDEQIEQAPESFVTKELPIQVVYDKEAANSQQEKMGIAENDISEMSDAAGSIKESSMSEENPNYLWGEAEFNRQHYNFLLNNNWSQDYKKVYTILVKGLYPPSMDAIYEYATDTVKTIGMEKESESTELSKQIKRELKDYQKQADEILKGLDCGEYRLACTNLGFCNEGELMELSEDHSAAILKYERMVDGVPITYTTNRMTENMAANVENASEEKINYSEHMEIAFDEEGLAQFYWENPCEISDLSEEYVFLLPFADIWKTFKDEVMVVNSFLNGYVVQKEIRISKIKLGYMWLPDTSAESDKEGTLIPVWDFIGNCDILYYYPDTGEEYWTHQDDSAEQSFLTINAMNGTVVAAPITLY